MATRALGIVDKRLLARRIGGDLVRHHGRKKHYSVAEVSESLRRQSIPCDWDCWALALYVSPSEFSAHHAQRGESCDYGSMHRSMLDSLIEPRSQAPDNVLDDADVEVTDESWWSELWDTFDFDVDP